MSRYSKPVWGARRRAKSMPERPIRLAIVVSHPIQYAVPLYRRLARRGDLELKVFFTWHDGSEAIQDRGFAQPVCWDIPLTGGYQFELVPNVSSGPGTHRFFGLRNPDLLERILSWRPDVVQITGWAWSSHLHLLRVLHRRRIVTLFFGDSHLLDGGTAGPRWWLKAALLRRVYAWPTGILAVGAANRAYFERFGVSPEKLYPCPHAIDVTRFAAPQADVATEAARWRAELQIDRDHKVLLFAGKFEPKKRPVELMRAVARLRDPAIVLVLVGAGALQSEIDALAAAQPSRFRVLPFQNQSRMPVVYRLGDVFVLPSSHAESWGLAVNEALACGTPVIVSDRVGCAADVVDPSCGRIFAWNDWSQFEGCAETMLGDGGRLAAMRSAARQRAWAFDVSVAEAALAAAAQQTTRSPRTARFGTEAERQIEPSQIR
jgi:glycosyltransferase involved in cell wall biosynthesis